MSNQSEEKKILNKKQKFDEKMNELATSLQISKQTLYQLNIFYWLIYPLKTLKTLSGGFLQRVSGPGFKSEKSNQFIQLLKQLSNQSSSQRGQNYEQSLTKQLSNEIMNFLKIQQSITNSELNDYLKRILKNVEYNYNQIIAFNQASEKKIDIFTQLKAKFAAQIKEESNINRMKREQFNDDINIKNQDICKLSKELSNLENQKKQKQNEYQQLSRDGQINNKSSNQKIQDRTQEIIRKVQNDQSSQQVNRQHSDLENLIKTIKSEIQQEEQLKNHIYLVKQNESKLLFLNKYLIKYVNEQDKKRAYSNTEEFPNLQIKQIENRLATCGANLEQSISSRLRNEEQDRQYLREVSDHFRNQYSSYIDEIIKNNDEIIDSNTKKGVIQNEITFISEQIENVQQQIQELQEEIGTFNDTDFLLRKQKKEEKSSCISKEIIAIQFMRVPLEKVDTISTLLKQIAQLISTQEKYSDCLEKFQQKQNPSYIDYSDINKLALQIVNSQIDISSITEYSEITYNSYNNFQQILENTLKISKIVFNNAKESLEQLKDTS